MKWLKVIGVALVAFALIFSGYCVGVQDGFKLGHGWGFGQARSHAYRVCKHGGELFDGYRCAPVLKL